MDIQEKKDLTRLNNLLLKYRNHIINVHHTSIPKYQIYETVNKIDESIINIQIGINKRS